MHNTCGVTGSNHYDALSFRTAREHKSNLSGCSSSDTAASTMSADQPFETTPSQRHRSNRLSAAALLGLHCDCKSGCSTRKCSCRASGVTCGSACHVKGGGRTAPACCNATPGDRGMSSRILGAKRRRDSSDTERLDARPEYTGPITVGFRTAEPGSSAHLAPELGPSRSRTASDVISTRVGASNATPVSRASVGTYVCV